MKIYREGMKINYCRHANVQSKGIRHDQKFDAKTNFSSNVQVNTVLTTLNHLLITQSLSNIHFLAGSLGC